ncbi:hypothetical protein ABEB36_015361 [Hypothenemus hampei]|uniref:Myb/SANT-like DNA-binding domain-containing protein n=1 Tax=Hypothenemus hampei TaxID=57062 RepID=A0ABD1E0W8_HYPHA
MKGTDKESAQNFILELNEFIIINHGVAASPMIIPERWTVNNTKLDLYKKYKRQVGTMQVKSIRHMWLLIAEELSSLSNISLSQNQCENRWRVLERNYKRYIENQNSTGREKKYFEYAAEMEVILGRKKNIVPQILLETDTINIPDTETNSLSATASTSNIPECSSTHENKTRKNIKKRLGTLEHMRLDRKTYFDRRIDIEQEKLSELKKRNDILKEKNSILKEYVELAKENISIFPQPDGFLND